MLRYKFNNANNTNYADIIAALQQPLIFDGPFSIASDGTANYNPAARENLPLCGAHIDAVYRPLSTIFNGSTSGSSAQNQFDYIDPQFYPASRTIPMNASLLIAAHAGGTTRVMALDPAASALMVDTWQEFTIRRVMCPSVPWDTIRQLENKINGLNDWRPANMTIPGLPNNTFPQGTLRFDSAEPIKRVMPYWDPNNPANNNLPVARQIQWWDILYKFSWRTTFDYWHNTHGDYVNNGLPAPLTWNVEWNPTISTGLHASFVIGWYEAYYNIQTAGVAAFYGKKYMNAEDPALPINNPLFGGAAHPFDTLFMVGAP